MSNYRIIYSAFWTDDAKVVDEFTPEDRYFYLYLLTNPHTNICGCYEISTRAIARETGYNEDTVKHLLGRMERVHNVIRYNPQTKELLIFKWHKYNWTKSPKLLKSVTEVAQYIKTDAYREYVLALANGDDTVSAAEIYPMDTSVSVSVSVSASAQDYKQIKIEKREDIEKIVAYLNQRAGTAFRANSKTTASHIKARLAEGFTVDDFMTVIDRKVADWGKDAKMAKYLRPETLFGSKFEGYLNERTPSGDRVMDELETIYRQAVADGE